MGFVLDHAPIINVYPRETDTTAYAIDILQKMADMIDRWTDYKPLRDLAFSLKGQTDRETMENIFWYCKDAIPYENDPNGVELLQAPIYTLLLGNPGDCDDMCIAAGTLLKILGYGVIIRAIDWRPGVNKYTHVYDVATLGAKQIAIDITLPDVGVQRIYKRNIDLGV